MRRARVLLLAVGLLGGCKEAEPAYEPAVVFDTATAWIRTATDSTRLLVELARTPAQKTYGLMVRPSLDPSSGMVFLYDSIQPGTAGFWMFRTRFPLDIAYVDSAGVIVRILEMEPCQSDMYASSCPTYSPQVPYLNALEVNRGWFTQHGVGEGAVLRVDSASGS
jgi:uncharacterized membrane protein (UPF0127 family)